MGCRCGKNSIRHRSGASSRALQSDFHPPPDAENPKQLNLRRSIPIQGSEVRSDFRPALSPAANRARKRLAGAAQSRAGSLSRHPAGRHGFPRKLGAVADLALKGALPLAGDGDEFQICTRSLRPSPTRTARSEMAHRHSATAAVPVSRYSAVTLARRGALAPERMGQPSPEAAFVGSSVAGLGDRRREFRRPLAPVPRGNPGHPSSRDRLPQGASLRELADEDSPPPIHGEDSTPTSWCLSTAERGRARGGVHVKKVMSGVKGLFFVLESI